MPVLLVSTRYAVAGSIRSYTEGVRRALESAGVPNELVRPMWFGKWPVGGAVLPTVRMLLRRQPSGRFVHAIDVESCFRGTAVVTVHDPLIRWEDGPRLREFPYRVQMRAAVGRAQRIVGVGATTADRIRRVFPETVDKVRWIPPPFDTQLKDPRPKERDLLWIGRNDPVKGLPKLLDVLSDPRLATLKTLVKWTPQPRWPDLTERVRAAWKSVPWVESVDHPVDLPTLQGWVAGARCLVSTSSAEGTHMVPMEAYVARTRIVLPRIPAYTDVYAPSAEGVHWYDPQSRDDLIRAILEGTGAPERFTPDRETLDRVSYPTVGAALRQAYLEAGWRGD